MAYKKSNVYGQQDLSASCLQIYFRLEVLFGFGLFTCGGNSWVLSLIDSLRWWDFRHVCIRKSDGMSHVQHFGFDVGRIR